MALLLTLSDGTTTLDLATASGAGIRLMRFRPPSADRKVTRSGPGPGMIGERTTSSALADATCEIEIRIESPSASQPRFGAVVAPDTNGIEVQYIILVALLEKARRWEEQRVGTPVRLAFRRNGANNTAYWTVTGATLGSVAGPDLWSLIEANTGALPLTFTLTTEPIAHAATVGLSGSPLDIALTPGVSNLMTIGTNVGGDVESPMALKIKKRSSGNNWTSAWIAQLGAIPDLTDYSGTADVGVTLNDNCQQASVSAGSTATFTGSGYTIDTSKQYPIRAFTRMKVTSGTASKVQVRLRVTIGSSGTSIPLPWVPFTGTSGSYFLVDLGELPRFDGYQNRVGQSSVSYFAVVDVQTVDASAATVRMDYTEFLSYFGLVHLTGIAVAQNDALYYEDIYSSESGAYVAPRQVPQAYQAVEATGVLELNADRSGRLARCPPGSASYLWFQAQSATLHQLTDTATLNASHLQMYHLGFRGNA